MRCQHVYEGDPGDVIARQCQRWADTIVLFTYRQGEATETKSLCGDHARYEAHNLNRWGEGYGHHARILAEGV